MKKLLLIANSDSSIFSYRSELLESLANYFGFKIGICVPFGEYIQEIMNDNYEFFNIKVNRHGINPFEDLNLFFKYLKLIDQFKPSVVLTYTIKPNIYGSLACAIKNIPCISNITGLGALENNKLLQPILIRMLRFALKNNKTIFFQNSHGLDFFKEKNIGNLKQYGLLPGSGVNTQHFVSIEYPKDKVVRYLFVARVIKEKGIDEFLFVSKKFKELGLNAEFHICGNCEQDYLDLLNKLNENGTIFYHGLIKDMRATYAMASCIVLPSYYPEGISNVLLEGAASARPIITTNHPGCRETVEDNRTGYIVKIKNQEDLLEKMKTFYDLSLEDKIKMGKLGRNKMEKEFDRKYVIQAYMNKINEIGLL